VKTGNIFSLIGNKNLLGSTVNIQRTETLKIESNIAGVTLSKEEVSLDDLGRHFVFRICRRFGKTWEVCEVWEVWGEVCSLGKDHMSQWC